MFFFGESNSYPLSYNYDSQSFTIQEKNTAFPHHNHHQNLIFGSYYNDHHLPYTPNNPPMLENFMINDPNNVTPLHNSASDKLLLEAPMADQRNSLICPSSVVSHLSSKRSGSSKKDRHTKICTAQGVRDRRIRLSIHIAREFFNLQDMLGFDKASKTLGWLLAKSSYAIDELARASTKANTDSTIESEDTIKEINYEKKILSGKTSKKKRVKKGKCKDNNDEIDEIEVRRAKARERARERTKMKQMMMIFNLNHQILENMSNQKAQENLMICRSSSFAAPLSQITSSCQGYNNQLRIRARESVVIKSKLSGLYHDYDDHEMSSTDYQEGYNHNNDSLTKLASESDGFVCNQLIHRLFTF